MWSDLPVFFPCDCIIHENDRQSASLKTKKRKKNTKEKSIIHDKPCIILYFHVHYSDVIMSMIILMVSQITGVQAQNQLYVQAQIKENIKALHHWPLCGEFTGDRWIPRARGQ